MNREKTIQITYFLLRIVAAFLFIQVGGMKIFDWFGGIPPEFGGHPAMWSQPWIAGTLEVFGGALIMVGLFTRPIAFILSGEMAVAYFQAHQPKGTWPIQNHGEQAVLFCFLYLFMAAYGGGAWSLDALIWGKRKNV